MKSERKTILNRFRQFRDTEPSRREYTIVASAMLVIAAIATAAIVIAQPR